MNRLLFKLLFFSKAGPGLRAPREEVLKRTSQLLQAKDNEKQHLQRSPIEGWRKWEAKNLHAERSVVELM